MTANTSEATGTKSKSYAQGSLLWPNSPFEFLAGKRRVAAYPGQSFWVCNSSLNQEQSGVVQVARSGRNSGTAWNFALADANKLFTTGA